MGSLFPFFGLNFLFWTLVGLARFFSERMVETMQHITSVEVRAKKNPADVNLFTVYIGTLTGAGWLFLTTIVLGSAGSVFELTGATVGGELGYVFAFLPSVVMLLLLWLLFAAQGGYVATLVVKVYDRQSLIAVGILFWLTSGLLLLQTTEVEAIPGSFFVLVATLVMAVLATLGGARIALFFPRDSKLPRTRENVFRLGEEGAEQRIRPHEVVSITPAHNEEETIGRTIASLKRILPPENIYVGSDASSDRTVEICRSLGVKVADIRPNRGKANVLQYLIDEYELCSRYKAVMIVDADSEVGREYLKKALPLFDDPTVAAVAVHALSKWKNHWPPKWSVFFAAHRVRFYRVLQAALRYGQTWKYMNVSPIVPGFGSIYRTSALRQIKINATGLVIEDFNMTFELYHRKLGRVAYSPQVHATSRDPLTLKDYYKQVKRWNLGFWQTVRRHGIWPSFFWFTLGTFLVEMLFFGLFFLLVPFILVWSLFLAPASVSVYGFSSTFMMIGGLVVLLFLVDYFLTIAVAIYERKPMLLLYGFGFILLRYVDTFAFLYTLPLAFFVRSDGRWISPRR